MSTPTEPTQPPVDPSAVPAPPSENPFASGSLAAAGPAPSYGSPSYGPPSPGTSYPAPDQFASTGVEDAGRAALKSATTTFFVGVGVVLAGLGTIIWASGDGGGVLWYGGVIFGGIILVRGLIGLVAARKAGARMGTGRVAAYAAGVVACLAAGAVAVLAYAVPGSVTPHVSTGVGSCWTADAGGKLTPVDCGQKHDLVGSTIVTDSASCPDSSDGYTEGDTAGTYLCLSKAG